jgi:hypothetical protein
MTPSSPLGITLIVIHTLISIAAIIAGAPAIADIFKSRRTSPAITRFLALAIATSVTGYIQPLKGVTPAVIVGIVALAILAAVWFAQARAASGILWKLVYVGGMVASLYLLVFVGIAQAFMKIPFLRESAPTQSEPPFLITQVVVLAAFVVLGLLALRAFKPQVR